MRVDPLQILTKLAAVQNIPTRRVTPPFEGLEEFDYGLRRSLDPQFDWQEFGQLLLDSTLPCSASPMKKTRSFSLDPGRWAPAPRAPANGSGAIWGKPERPLCRSTTTA